MEPNETPVETPAPTIADLNAPEYRTHREQGTSVAELVKARTPEPTEPVEEPAKPVDRDPLGRFVKPAEEPKPKTGNPRHDPRARIDELTREKSEAIRRAEAAEAERERYRTELEAFRKGDGPKPDKPAEPPAAPEFTFPDYDAWLAEDAKRADGRDPYAAYIRASTRAELKFEREHEEAQKAQETRQRSAQDAFATFSERQTAFKASHADFDDLVRRSPVSQMETPPWSGHAIVTSEHGPALQYYLLQHPDETKRIFALDGPAAVRELGRIEATLTTSAAVAPTATTAPALPVTKADPPLEAVGASASASTRSLGAAAAANDAKRYRELRESGVRL